MTQINPCPYCRADCAIDLDIVDHKGTAAYWACCRGCTYRSTDELTEEGAITKHNRVARCVALVQGIALAALESNP